MVIGIFGESCTGKSTLAEKTAASFLCEVFTGKDYLRLTKNENIAKLMFGRDGCFLPCGVAILQRYRIED